MNFYVSTFAKKNNKEQPEFIAAERIKQTVQEKINGLYYIKVEIKDDTERYYLCDDTTLDFVCSSDGRMMEDSHNRLRSIIVSYLSSVENIKTAKEYKLSLMEFIRINNEIIELKKPVITTDPDIKEVF